MVVVRILILVVAMVSLPAMPEARAQGLNPAQTAFLTAASRRIEDHFVSEVARITGTSAARVRKAMPDERRITATAARLISALEVDLGAPLSAEQQAAIHEADQSRKQSIMLAREAALGQR